MAARCRCETKLLFPPLPPPPLPFLMVSTRRCRRTGCVISHSAEDVVCLVPVHEICSREICATTVPISTTFLWQRRVPKMKYAWLRCTDVSVHKQVLRLNYQHVGICSFFSGEYQKSVFLFLNRWIPPSDGNRCCPRLGLTNLFRRQSSRGAIYRLSCSLSSSPPRTRSSNSSKTSF